MRNNRALLVSGCLLFIIVLVSPTHSQNPGVDVNRTLMVGQEPSGLVIDNFDDYGSDLVDRNWMMRHAWKFDEVNLQTGSLIYRVVSDGSNHFLHASTEGRPDVSVLLVRLVNSHKVVKGETVRWNLQTHPFLSWRWRVTRIPDGAREDNKRKFDNAASIFVIFVRYDLPILPWNWQPIDVLQYTWSSTLPQGFQFAKKAKRFGFNLYEGRFVVLQSGMENTGKWIQEKRNILQDYRNCFGHYPAANPLLLALITDSDKTRSVSVADYDDFILLDK